MSESYWKHGVQLQGSNNCISDILLYGEFIYSHIIINRLVQMFLNSACKYLLVADNVFEARENEILAGC